MKRKVIYLYKETHLPAEGWLQGCFICDTITSKTEDFKPNIVNEKNQIYCSYLPYLPSS